MKQEEECLQLKRAVAEERQTRREMLKQARRQDVRSLKPRDKVPGKEPYDGDKDAGPKESQPEQKSLQRHIHGRFSTCLNQVRYPKEVI